MDEILLEETQCPTISTESLFLTCLIDAMEGCQVITCDDDILHLKPVGGIGELLVKVDPSYSEFVRYGNGKMVIYAELK